MFTNVRVILLISMFVFNFACANASTMAHECLRQPTEAQRLLTEGKPVEAMKSATSQVERARQRSPRDDIAVAICLHNLGGVALAVGEFDQAINANSEILQINTSLYGPTSDQVMQSLRLRGEALLMGSRLSDALADLKAAEQIAAKLGPSVSNRADEIYSALAEVNRRMDDYRTAIGYEQRALDLLEREFGKDSLPTARPLDSIGR